jgi:hypothetical protein
MAIERGIDLVAFASLGMLRTAPDYPAEADVRSGVGYANGTYTGSLVAGGGFNASVRVETTNQR